jgi:acyl dehydratase
MTEQLPIYRVRARNTSADSENKIHDNATAAGFGFRGGLVPGVVVFGYLTVPIVARFPEWLERGSMQVRFARPFYEGDSVEVRAEATRNGDLISINAQAWDADGAICATASASVGTGLRSCDEPRVWEYQTQPLPSSDARLAATAEALMPGTVLGTLVERLDLRANQEGLLEQINEGLPVYFGPSAAAHPVVMLGIANHMLMHNVALGPWIHASSELTNFSVARDGEEITVRGSITEQFERKGHQFVVLDLLLTASGRLVQQVRHTAIYSIRPA